MSTTLTIKDERAELLTFDELDPKIREDFDYIDREEMYDPRFFCITMGKKIEDRRVEWYDANEFIASTNPEFAEWDGVHADTFFSGVLIKFLEDDDDGFLRVAFVYS